jgi:hypothetical protein
MMLYIGTSLGKCLRSVLLGEVPEDDILLIVTRTMAPDMERFIDVVKQYYEQGNYTARNPHEYDLSVKPWEEVEALATRLYNGGKIHQPRIFVSLGSQFIHPDLSNDTWVEVSPKSRNTTPAVKQAYEQYKMLDALTK